MSDPEWDAVHELRCITACTCAPAWTRRGKHEVDCVAYCRGEVDLLAAGLARLRAVVDAARVFHAKGPDYWDDGHGDPEWIALGAALDALDGSDRG